MPQPEYRALADFLVARGFAVLVPERLGHGGTGGKYLEDQGGCDGADYSRAGRATADQIIAAMNFLRRQPFIRPDRTLVVGHSAGGWGALALGEVRGVSAIIVFAPGRGGHANDLPNQLCAPQAILASNTSSISITALGAATRRPARVIGMHFMNPVPVMKLVEIINGYATKKEVTDKIVEITKQLGKIPCVVNDYPGFISNRILLPMINEAIYSLYEGVAGVEEIDTVMKLGMAHPMGPLQLADFIGLDVCLSILNVLHEGFGNPKYAPCPLLTNMVTARKFGVKTGEGFYTYEPGNKELVVSERFK
jgi:hypothetical protein